MEKKNCLLVGLLVLGMVAMSSCGDVGGEYGPELNGTMEELAPSVQKKRLQDVGLEFMNTIKAGDHENLVDVVAFMADEFEYFDIDEDYYEKLESLYGESYAQANPMRAMYGLMGLSLYAAQHGSKLPTRSADVWLLSVNAGLSDLYGRFTPDMEEEIWVYDSSVNDRVEVAFSDDHNQKWVATLKGSKETTQVKVMATNKEVYEEVYEDGPDDGRYSDPHNSETDCYEFLIEVPKQITFVVKCNSDEVVKLTINSSLALDVNCEMETKETDYYYWDYWYDYYYWYDYDYETTCALDIDYSNLNLEASLKVNAYEETFKTEVTKQGVKASAGVKVNGKQMLKAETVLNADMNKILEMANDVDAENVTYDAGVIKGLSVSADIMGKVQIIGKCDKFEDLYDALIDIEETEDFKKFERNVNQANKAYDIAIHYDNTKTVQAKVELEAYEYENYWDTYFSTRPVLVFSVDDSRYTFEDYFTESSFSDLIEAAEDLGENFERLFYRYF